MKHSGTLWMATPPALLERGLVRVPLAPIIGAALDAAGDINGSVTLKKRSQGPAPTPVTVPGPFPVPAPGPGPA
jgi:hypothetical protein